MLIALLAKSQAIHLIVSSLRSYFQVGSLEVLMIAKLCQENYQARFECLGRPRRGLLSDASSNCSATRPKPGSQADDSKGASLEKEVRIKTREKYSPTRIAAIKGFSESTEAQSYEISATPQSGGSDAC